MKNASGNIGFSACVFTFSGREKVPSNGQVQGFLVLAVKVDKEVFRNFSMLHKI
jgi:hypothetical protein